MVLSHFWYYFPYQSAFPQIDPWFTFDFSPFNHQPLTHRAPSGSSRPLIWALCAGVISRVSYVLSLHRKSFLYIETAGQAFSTSQSYLRWAENYNPMLGTVESHRRHLLPEICRIEHLGSRRCYPHLGSSVCEGPLNVLQIGGYTRSHKMQWREGW